MWNVGRWKERLARAWHDAIWEPRPEERALSRRFRAHLRAWEAAALSFADREALAVRCMLEAARAFLGGAKGPTAEALAAATAVLDIRKQVLNVLVARGLLVVVAEDTTRGEEREERYLPGRDPDDIALKEPIDAIRWAGETSMETAGDAAASGAARGKRDGGVATFVSELARRLDQVLASATAGLTVAEAVRRIEARAPDPLGGTPAEATRSRDARS